MSGRVASFLLLFNGQLIVNENSVPSYVGGKNRPLEVPGNTKLRDLKCRVLQTLNYDITKYKVNLVCRIPIGNEFIATNVDDEDVCRIVMRQACSQFMVLYVDIEEVPIMENFGHAEVANNTAPILTTQDTEDVELPIFPQYDKSLNTAGPSRQNTLRFVDQSDEPLMDRPNIEDTYETMSSGSSGASSDEYDMEPENVDVALINADTSTLIRDYCYRTTGLEDQMTTNNEYYAACRTAEDWDRETDNDMFDGNIITEPDFTIPEELIEGMCFSSKGNLQFAVQGWSIKNNVEYDVIASNSKKFTASCTRSDAKSRPCQWRLHASLSKRLGGTWKLSTLTKDHTCVNPILECGHKQCTSKFISYFILPTIRKQIDLKPREIISLMEAKFNVRVNYIKAWDARRKAIKSVFGSWEESYRSIYLFMDAINSTMPGSVYRIQSSQSNRFERIFWAFQPCIVGWNYCRPILSLDGTFLLGKYRGTLLSAVGIDANNGLLPLAFAIVESECNDSWFWFLRCLQDLIPQSIIREDLCFISDRHHGIVRGCRELFPSAAHRVCLRHLRENFKKAIRKMGISDVEFLCQKMYNAGSTDDIRLFRRHMTDIRKVKEEACKWLLDRDISSWSLTHDKGFRYGTMTTNASESFNGVLKRARGLPIQALITAIYYNIIGIFLKRRNQIGLAELDSNTIFCKNAVNALAFSEADARVLREPTRINQEEFEVLDKSGISYRVDILEDGQSRCQCGKPEIYHIPCAHLISCLSVLRRSHYDYVSEYYTLDRYKATYAMDFHCIPDRSNWVAYDPSRGFSPLTPPNYRRRSGRPRVRRYKNTMDESSNKAPRKCSHCHMFGHNISTCPRRLM